MLRSKCPWCNHKVSTHQLGSRESEIKPKWYSLTRNISVCPYCNNKVKVSIKSIRWIVLMLPLFVLFIVRAFLGSDIIPVSPFNEIGFSLAVIGLVISIFTIKYEKDDRL